MTKTYSNFQKVTILNHKCIIKKCKKSKNIKIKQLRLLYRHFSKYEENIEQNKAKKFLFHFFIKFSLKKKQLCLCTKHKKH